MSQRKIKATKWEFLGSSSDAMIPRNKFCGREDKEVYFCPVSPVNYYYSLTSCCITEASRSLRGLTWRTCLNCSSKLQLLFCGGEFVESRGGGELASLFDDDPPGGVNDADEDRPLEERFCGISCRAEPPPAPAAADDSWGGRENAAFCGV